MMRTVSPNRTHKKGRRTLQLLGAASLLLTLSSNSQAVAPARSGQPYAESICSTDPNVIFCEDFNYPQNFYCTPTPALGNFNWINPGLAQVNKDFAYCAGLQINPASNYPTQPTGSPTGGSVWVGNWNSSKGTTGSGATWGNLRVSGGNYVNGSSPAKEVYVRFQIYRTTDWAWPGDSKTDPYGYGSYPCYDNKIMGLFPPEGPTNPTNSAYGPDLMTLCGVYDPVTGGRFSDALVTRYGNNNDNNKWFPTDAGASSNPQHMEYTYQIHGGSLPLRDPNDTPIAIAFNNPNNLGRLFRFNTNQWYTLEWHYILSSAPDVKDGTVEVFVNGNRIYSANGLATCGSGTGDCSGIGALGIYAYHNISDVTHWNGQQIIDNLIISRSYIGPPQSGPTTPPAAPGNLTVSP